MSTDLKIRPQKVPFHARQVTRLLAVALTKAGWLPQDRQDEVMSGDGLPAMLITTPDGREFLVTVEQVS
jgi:hypothetical protein